MRFGSSHVPELVEPDAGLRRHGVNGARAKRHRLDLVEERRHVVDEVDLREQDDRLRAALPRHREVPLEPPHVEVERQRLDEERDVDVRGEHLLAHGVPDLLAGDRRAPVEHGFDELRVGIDADPVADGRQLVLLDEPGRGARAQLSRFGEQVVGASVLDRDAGGHEPGGAVLGERGLPAVVPAKPVKQRFRSRKSQPKLLCVL